MVKLPSRQRQHRHRQGTQLRIVPRGVFAQCATKFGVEVVSHSFAIFTKGTLAQQFHRAIAEQPDTDIHQRKVRCRQARQIFNAGFLQHKVQTVGVPAVDEEHAVVFGQSRVYPQAITHHIGFGNRL